MNIPSKKESDPWSREWSHITKCFLRYTDTVKNKLAKISRLYLAALYPLLRPRVGVNKWGPLRHAMWCLRLSYLCFVTSEHLAAWHPWQCHVTSPAGPGYRDIFLTLILDSITSRMLLTKSRFIFLIILLVVVVIGMWKYIQTISHICTLSHLNTNYNTNYNKFVYT